MGLVAAKCTQCGASIKVDKTKDAEICEYCGTAFITEKAINNYGITNKITDSTVNFFGDGLSDFVIRAGNLEKYNGADTDVIIPNNITKIGDEAFSGCECMTSVIIPYGVKVIGERAFSGCEGITGIIIPDSVKEIEKSAFENCKNLSHIKIPSLVTTIECATFHGCTSLESIEFPENLASIESYAFGYCSSLKSITLPNELISIGNSAFVGSGLIEVNNYYEYWNFIYHRHKNDFFHTKPNGTMIPWTEREIAMHMWYWFLPAFEDTPYYKKNEYKGNFLSLNNNSNNNSNGCYVATSIYGSYNCPEVWTLRRFRDGILALSWYGRIFIKIYYIISPILVKVFGNTKFFKKFGRDKLDKLVIILNKKGFKDTFYED